MNRRQFLGSLLVMGAVPLGLGVEAPKVHVPDKVPDHVRHTEYTGEPLRLKVNEETRCGWMYAFPPINVMNGDSILFNHEHKMLYEALDKYGVRGLVFNGTVRILTT